MPKITYYNGSTDAYSGQMNMEAAIYVDGQIVGAAEYVLYDGELTISDIQVRPEWRRNGMGSRLIKYIKQENPEYKYVPSLKTELGSKFVHKDLPLDERAKAKLVYESLDFERGIDPKDAMKIGSIEESVDFVRRLDPKRALEIGLPSKMGEGYTVLWRDRRSKWSIERYTNPHTKEPNLVIVSDDYIDYPILYSDGRISYDDPYRLPKLIRDKAHKLYLQIKGFNESVNFNRGADPKKTLEIGEYRPHIVKFNDYDGEVQTIKVQNNSFKLFDMDVRIEFKEDPDIGVSGDVYVDGQKSDINLFRIEPFDYEFKEQGKYDDPGYTGYGMPIAKDKEDLKRLKEEHAYWTAISGNYSRENKNPFSAAAQLILFKY